MNVNIRSEKLRKGFAYGLVAGISFAVFGWGMDAWILAHANASYYWTKFIPGLLICGLAGGIVGWFTMLAHKHAISLLLWGLLAGFFTWLVVWLPLTGSPRLINWLNPSLASWFQFSQVQNIGQIYGFSLTVIGLAAVILGLLEINLVDQAVVSSYSSGTVMALIICIFLFGLAGSATDHLINANLREPVQVINTLLLFARENAGVDVPKATARQMHLSATRLLDDLVNQPYKLTVSGFDKELGIIDILADFKGSLVKCSTIYNQPLDCIILTPNP